MGQPSNVARFRYVMFSGNEHQCKVAEARQMWIGFRKLVETCRQKWLSRSHIPETLAVVQSSILEHRLDQAEQTAFQFYITWQGNVCIVSSSNNVSYYTWVFPGAYHLSKEKKNSQNFPSRWAITDNSVSWSSHIWRVPKLGKATINCMASCNKILFFLSSFHFPFLHSFKRHS